jgi:YD repeat-containing protein
VEVFDKTGRPIRTAKNYYRLNPNNFQPKIIKGFNGGSFAWTSASHTDFWYGNVSEPQNRYRYGRYEIISEHIVLEKSQELTYDQVDINKVIGRTTLYAYDPTHLLPVETTTFLDSNPGQKLISKTKYVVHTDYDYSASTSGCEQTYTNCANNCANEPDPQVRNDCYQGCEQNRDQCIADAQLVGSSETQAILELRNKHQISTPVEIQKILEDNGSTRLMSSAVYKYNKEGSPTVFVKPKEILGLNRPLAVSEYKTSKIDPNGNFEMDGRLRTLHTFNNYDPSNGNILRQTLANGVVSDYVWTHNNSLLFSNTINPGAQQHSSTYTHKPSVGITAATDPNGVATKFEYDPLNRLKYTKDYQDNITSRHRYHYAFQDESFTASLTFSGNHIPISTITTTVSYKPTEFGQTTYQWNMGDGTTLTTTTNSVDHSYTTMGSYLVTVTISNPDYGSASASKTIVIGAQMMNEFCIDGPISGNRCSIQGPEYGGCTGSYTPSNPTVFKITSSTGGCGGYTYKWEYYDSALDAYVLFGSDLQATFPHQTGSYSITCTVKDACNNIAYLSAEINLSYECN